MTQSFTRRAAVLGAAAASLPLAAQAQDSYARLLADALGSPVDPATAHQTALGEVRRLHARADRLLAAQGLRQGSVAERLRQLAMNTRYLYPDDSAGRDRAVADMNARLRALRPALKAAFGNLIIPPAEVRRMTPADESRGRSGYREAPAYYVDLKNIRARPAWTLPSVAFHETVPGHLLQLAHQATPLTPARQRYGTAFGEAWATYAEQLAADLGAYRNDPLGELGFIQWMLFRVGRIAVDTGLGSQRWSREQAIARMREIQGQSIAFITIEADVDRMIKSPGQAAAQGLGALALASLRPRDRRRWPAYHQAVLKAGPAPLAEIEAAIREARR